MDGAIFPVLDRGMVPAYVGVFMRPASTPLSQMISAIIISPYSGQG
jgi:hypothetical protein